MNILWIRLWDFFTVPDTFDPDDLRLRRVCNGVLAVISFISLVSAAISWVGHSSLYAETDAWPIYFQRFSISLLGFLLGVGLFILNRWKRTPKYLVGVLLVSMIVALLLFSDSPEGLLGQSQLIWVWPILVSAIVLPPRSTFLVDGILTMIIIFLTPAPILQKLNYWTLLTLFTIAFFAWLGMSVAEHAIQDARKEAEKNRAILDGVADGVVVVGVDNRITLANPVALELLNGELFKILSAADSAEIGGRTLSLRWNTVQGVGRIAIVHDITRQIEIERAKDAILRVVSHEMRTPLAAILGFAEILETRHVPGMAARIRANAQRMLKLVNDLLDVAQLQAGALTIHAETFSPSVLVAYIHEHFLKPAEEKEIDLQVSISPTLPGQVLGDVQRLEQVVSNLVENAIKFTEQGGRVTVSFGAAKETSWQIVVKDTGIGIPSERLSDIFEPFRRASDYARRKHQGIGLGLSIVKRIVERSGGSISVESVMGQGSTFTVSLSMQSEIS